MLSIDELKLEIKKLESKRTLTSNCDELDSLYQDLSDRLRGSKVKCVASRDLRIIKEGEVYDFVRIEAGIFASQPYTTILTNDGKTIMGYSYRFEAITEIEEDRPLS